MLYAAPGPATAPLGQRYTAERLDAARARAFGFTALVQKRHRHAAVWRRYDFAVVDCENIHTWGGTDSDWSNATHVNQINTRRMLGYIVAHSDGALH